MIVLLFAGIVVLIGIALAVVIYTFDKDLPDG